MVEQGPWKARLISVDFLCAGPNDACRYEVALLETVYWCAEGYGVYCRPKHIVSNAALKHAERPADYKPLSLQRRWAAVGGPRFVAGVIETKAPRRLAS